MDMRFDFSTDAATLAAFDPGALAHRAGDVADWWCIDMRELEELRSGTLALVGLGGDGSYRARATDGELLDDERDYAASLVTGLGVEVRSGRLFLGRAECLPGGGVAFDAGPGEGATLEVENGRYDVDLYGISWHRSSRWWREDFAVPDGAPADIVLVLRPRTGEFAVCEEEPRLDFSSDTYLFESESRRLGPEPGMLLTTRVRRGPSKELVLVSCGPGSYAASLVDTSQIAWKDDIRLRVLRVDHEARTLVGEFVEKLAP